MKIPSIASGADTDIYLYYDSTHVDNTAYVGDPADAVVHNVWDENFMFVSHMRDDPDNTAIRDSTSNNNDGAKAVAGNPAVTASEMIGDSQTFDGADKLTISASTDFVFGTGQFTVKHWVYVVQSGDVVANVGLFSGYDGGGWFTELKPGAAYTYGFYDMQGHRDTGVAIKYGEWVEFTMVRRGTGSNQAKIYINGVEEYQWTSTYNFTANNVIYIGSINIDDYPTSYRFKGGMDEIQVSDIDRSPAWIKASYESERDHLNDFGGEEEYTSSTSSYTISKKVKIVFG